MTKSSPYIRLRSLNKNGLLIAQFSRYQFIPSAKLFTQYISRPFLFKIYGCDLVVNLLDIIGYISGLCLSARACRVKPKSPYCHAFQDLCIESSSSPFCQLSPVSSVDAPWLLQPGSRFSDLSWSPVYLSNSRALHRFGLFVCTPTPTPQ